MEIEALTFSPKSLEIAKISANNEEYNKCVGKESGLHGNE